MRRMLFAAVLVACGLAAHAATITYTGIVTATGSLNGTAFTNALLTLQATADSSTITSAAQGTSGSMLYIAPTLTFGGNVAGLGAFNLASGMTFDNQRQGNAGFTSSTGADILDIVNSFFSTYDLKSAVSLTGSPLFNATSTATLDRGNLILSNLGSTATFQAQLTPAAVTPEPSSFALLATGLVGIGGLLRKRLA